MWRHLTRGLQQNFKRSLCLEKSDSCVKDGTTPQSSHQHGCALLRAIQNLKICHITDSKNQNNKEYYEKSTGNISQHTLFEAFGWSGALVFGWAISKQFWVSHKWSRDEDLPSNSKIVQHNSFVEFLSHVVKTQPPARSILPPIKTTRQTEKDLKNKEDELETAAQEFKEIHERVIGEALNRRGIACLSKTSGSEAVKYFKRASALKYPPASFNMGQCCELGIGTKQDFKQAAEWYTKASEQGHATAMYNLGVFYAHGWGGLQADTIAAKELFVKAAKLGQPDAKAALEKEYKAVSNIHLKTCNSQSPIISDNVCKTQCTKTLPGLNIFVQQIRSELNDNVFQKEFGPEKKWDVPLSSTVAF